MIFPPDWPPVGWQIDNYVETGESWISYDKSGNSYVYINIPKNASSWMMHAFVRTLRGFDYNFITNKMSDPTLEYQQSDRNYPVPTYIVILRDPVSRWLSGASQPFFNCEPDNPCFFMNYTNEQLFDQVVFDEHTAPQTLFLKHIDLSRGVFFDCNSDLKRNFAHWAQDKFDIDLKMLDDRGSNISANNQRKTFPSSSGNGEIVGWSQQEVINELQSRLDSNPQYVQRLKEFYANDYNLRESVNFYVSR